MNLSKKNRYKYLQGNQCAVLIYQVPALLFQATEKDLKPKSNL